MQNILLRLSLILTLMSAFTFPDALAQDSSGRDLNKRKKTSSSDEDGPNAPWKKMPLLLDRPDKPYEVIGLG